MGSGQWAVKIRTCPEQQLTSKLPTAHCPLTTAHRPQPLARGLRDGLGGRGAPGAWLGGLGVADGHAGPLGQLGLAGDHVPAVRWEVADDHSLGAEFMDVNGDGRPDLYVANDENPNRLYLNRPGGPLGFHFVDVARQQGVADPNAGMGVA